MLAEPIGVSVEQVLPRVTVAAGVMKQVYQLFRDRLAARTASDDDGSSDDDVLCFLCGDAASIAHAKRVTITRVERKQVRHCGGGGPFMCIRSRHIDWLCGASSSAETSGTQRCSGCPCTQCWGSIEHCGSHRSDASLFDVDTVMCLTLCRIACCQATYVAAITSAQQAYTDDKTDALTAKLQPTLLVTSSTVHSAQLDFQLECPAPPLLFRFSLIRSLPLLMTPLAASLSRQEFGSGEAVRRSGYLTLDRARKAVPVLKTDPLIVQQPLVGVWVYGVPLSEEWSDGDMSTQFADPYLYFACLGYISSRAIKEKADVSKNTFLVALYPSGRGNQQQVSPLPRFFECSYSEHVDVHAPIPMELYAQQKSCLVGVSSFSEEVEFSLSPSPCDTWESARQQLGIPTAPTVRRNEATVRRADPELDQLSSSSSEASVRSARARNSISRVTFRKPGGTNNSDNIIETPLKRSSLSTRCDHSLVRGCRCETRTDRSSVAFQVESRDRDKGERASKRSYRNDRAQ